MNQAFPSFNGRSFATTMTVPLISSIQVSMANQKNRGDGMGGGVSPPSATWGGVTAWPGPSTSPWPGQSSGPQPLTGHSTDTAILSKLKFRRSFCFQ